MEAAMPIFAKGETKDKLTILFFAREADLDLTQEQLYRAMVENDWHTASNHPMPARRSNAVSATVSTT